MIAIYSLQSEGDQSGVEVGAKSEDRKFNEAGTGGERRPKRKNRPPRDFCVKLSNLTRDIRVKDLKTELRKRECNPLAITWKGKWIYYNSPNVAVYLKKEGGVKVPIKYINIDQVSLAKESK